MDTVSAQRRSDIKPLSDFKGDTLQYIRDNFIYHKDLYIDRPLSVLLHDLGLSVMSSISLVSNKRGFEAGLALCFCCNNSERTEKVYAQEGFVEISFYWKDPIPADSLSVLSTLKRGNWSEEEQAFYSRQVIGSMEVYDTYALKR